MAPKRSLHSGARAGACWTALALALLAGPAAAIDIDQLAIQRGVGQPSGVGSWFVEISISGSDLSSAILSSAAGGSIVLTPSAMSGQLSGGALYSDLQALDAAFPLGSWLLDINDGELLENIPFDPRIDPNGSALIGSPRFGESEVSLTPTMFVDDQCTNCELYSGSTGFGDTVLVGRLALAGDPLNPIETIPVPNTTTQIDFSSPLLPGRSYRFETAVATNNYMPFSFGSDSFDYYQLSTQTQSTEFTTVVPEPGTAALVAIGLAGLSAARRRSRAR